MSDFGFPSIERYNGQSIDDAFVFEKVDGGNASIRWQNGQLVPWSRGGPIGGSRQYFFDNFRTLVFGGELSPEIYNLPPNYVLFGEFTHYGGGHLHYSKENMNRFFLIGIYDSTADQFLHPEQRDEELNRLQLAKKIPPVPLLYRGPVTPALADELTQQSKLYPGTSEGIVIHQYGNYPRGLQMLKHYHPSFQEVDPTKGGVEAYLTRRRYIKAGQRALEKGDLTPERVREELYNDIYKEMPIDGKRQQHAIGQVITSHQRELEEIIAYLERDTAA